MACMNTVKKKNMPKMAVPTQQHDQVRAGPVAVPQQSQRHQRVRAAVLDDCERSKQHHAVTSETTTLASPQCEVPSGLVAALDSP
jgi:hypothetical protein